MIRSRRLSDYHAYDFSEIRAEVALPCDLYLVFQMSDHVLLFKKAGDVPERGLLERYFNRGLRKIWIFTEDRPLFEAYLKPEATVSSPVTPHAPVGLPEAAQTSLPHSPENPPEAPPPAAPSSEEPKALIPAKTEAGATLSALIEAPQLDEPTREEAVSQVAQQLFKESANVETPQEQKAADETLRQAMNDVIQRSALSGTPSLQDLWTAAQGDPELEHGVNVATYAVCFALAFGKSAPQIIADLTIAGLLHDVGMSQLPASIASKPWTEMSEEEQQVYHHHVESSEALLAELDSSVPPGAIEIIRQHHEKFDGTGYPEKISGFSIPDTSQILSMADLLETIRAGLWDGKIRTRREAYAVLEERDRSRSYPEYFNPETFKRVKTFIHSTAGQAAFEQASTEVSEKAEELTKAA